MDKKRLNEIVLPADVYDALELTGKVFGGFGSGSYVNYDKKDTPIPCCVVGHLKFLKGLYDEPRGSIFRSESDLELDRFLQKSDGELIDRNDSVIKRRERISWKQLCKRANIVRGKD